MSNYTFICPSPLVYAHESKYTTVWAYKEGNCAVACPTVTYSSEEWHDYWKIVTALSVISLVLSLFSTIFHAYDVKKYFIRTMFVSGFLVNAFILTLFFFLNEDNQVVCDGDKYYIEKSFLCVFQAASVIFLFIWIEVWSVILAVDTYYHIQSKISMDEIGALNKRYFIIALSISSVVTLIPLSAGNLGFDPKANIPICLYLFSDNSYYFWITLFLPFILLNIACMSITLMGSYRLQEIFVSSGNFDSTRSAQTSLATPMVQPNYDDSYRYDESAFSPSHMTQQRAESTDSCSDIYGTRSSGFDMDAYLTRSSMLSDPPMGHIPSSTVTSPITTGGMMSPLPSNRPSEASSNAKSDQQRDVSTASWLQTLVNSFDFRVNSSQLRYRRKVLADTWKYNGRSIVFVAVFCLTTLYIAPMLFYLNYVKYDHFIDGTEDFVQCLVEAAAISPDRTQEGVNKFAEDVCGEVPSTRPDKPEVLS